MIPKSIQFLFASCMLVGAVLFAGCIDIPSDGHTPPDYTALVKVVYLDPTISPATVNMALGPNFESFSVLNSGAFGSASSYMTIPAGAKKLYLSSVPADTISLTVDVDQKGTFFVFPKTSATNPRIRFIGDRYTFASPGQPDSGLIRFTNAIMRAATDTEDVAVDVIQFFVRNNIVSSRTLASGVDFTTTTAYFKIPKDSTYNFYLTRTGSSVHVTDTLVVTGMSNTQATAISYGQIDAMSGVAQFTKFDDN